MGVNHIAFAVCSDLAVETVLGLVCATSLKTRHQSFCHHLLIFYRLLFAFRVIHDFGAVNIDTFLNLMANLI